MMANGGVIAPVGMNMVALAAQRHSVPFVVLAGVHKVLCCKADFSLPFLKLHSFFVISLISSTYVIPFFQFLLTLHYQFIRHSVFQCQYLQYNPVDEWLLGFIKLILFID